MTNDDYTKYSLENLSKWFTDAISSTEATPQEIYDTIKEAIQEEYSYHLDKLSRASVLSHLFGVSGADLIKPKSIEEIGEVSDNNSTDSWTKEDVLRQRDYYGPIKNNSTLTTNNIVDFTNLGATDRITFTSCDANDTSPECKNSWNSFWNDQYQTPFVSEDGDVWKTDKITKWVLPVELDGLTGDCVVTLPDDLLERVGWVEGDTVEFVSNTNGSFTVKKVVKSEV